MKREKIINYSAPVIAQLGYNNMSPSERVLNKEANDRTLRMRNLPFNPQGNKTFMY